MKLNIILLSVMLGLFSLISLAKIILMHSLFSLNIWITITTLIVLLFANIKFYRKNK